MKITSSTSEKEIIEFTSDCKQCGHCCKFGSGFLSETDFEPLSQFLNITVDELKNHYLEEVSILTHIQYRPKLLRTETKPFGPCIFLENGSCRVHPVKPLYCRIGSGCKSEADLIWQWFLHHHGIKESKSARDEFEKLINGYKAEGRAIMEIIITEKNKNLNPCDLDKKVE